MKIIVLGAGSAYGSPMIFNRWQNLNPNQPKNIRNRASIYMEIDGKKMVVDAGPEFRLELNQNNITDLDALLLTHGHYDHIGGIPELSRACTLLEHSIDVWASEETEQELRISFGFLFKGREAESVGINWRRLPDLGEVEISGIKMQTFQVLHSRLHCSAFRCRDFAYVTDWEEMPEEGLERLKGLKVLIIECNNGLEPRKNGHSDLENVKKVVSKIKPERVILTHLSTRMDYDATSAILPDNFELAYDGLKINI